MPKENGKRTVASLSLALDPGQVTRFFPLLQQGFDVRVETGGSIKDLLTDQFGVDPEYIVGRITTIFLNGKAIDDLDSARVKDGSTLALSAAMPGLVGATMRRGGFYAAMRNTITHQETSDAGSEKTGVIRIKLFNLLMSELGPVFLRHGIFLAPAALGQFLADQPEAFWGGCRKAVLNTRPVDPESLRAGAGLCSSGEAVHLCVIFEE